ncbi:MAG: ATP-dependent Clp protease ATP-binding subunit ClpX, partial [Lachnospiraceae bacterium]|nr:ATP-dependent Clp protease ATP-binding subunit ClpX [Lachnospiraceae bacterium]
MTDDNNRELTEGAEEKGSDTGLPGSGSDEVNTGGDDENKYEDVCYVCRRTESQAGPMIHLPGSPMCLCSDCFQKSVESFKNSNINLEEFM